MEDPSEALSSFVCCELSKQFDLFMAADKYGLHALKAETECRMKMLVRDCWSSPDVLQLTGKVFAVVPDGKCLIMSLLLEGLTARFDYFKRSVEFQDFIERNPAIWYRMFLIMAKQAINEAGNHEIKYCPNYTCRRNVAVINGKCPDCTGSNLCKQRFWPAWAEETEGTKQQR